jgi:hypothetical protein
MPTTKTVTVTIDTTTNQVTHIDFNPLPVHFGDSVVWQISGLTSGHSLTFDFDPDGNAPHGLFNQISTNPVAGSDDSDVTFTGTDFFQPEENVTSYHYNLWVDDPANSPPFDPMIDSLGPPV